MAGTINRDDIAAVREKAPLEDIVRERVALKQAGVGSLKGLCPFHDEKSPSFHVRPMQGHWHCFGCGEGGDVIAFIMKADGLPFADAVEYLAGRAGVTLRYESGGTRGASDGGGGRRRLLEANRVAAEYFVEQLLTPEAKTGRDFLTGRGFGKDAAAQFGVGYAPKGWSALLEHLRGKGFTEPEIEASGLVSRGQSASGQSARLYDRFRGRLVWPIRAVTGEVVGFGARKLYEDDEGPKYLNTPETALYKKSQVLYGLDLAKKDIAATHRVVVVEGYTDVMACHLSGVTTAVATCGTAFGADHVGLVRRLIGDITTVPPNVLAQPSIRAKHPEIIFTFDADDAGQNAALKSFAFEPGFLSQTFVAVAPDRLDPCELRLERGDPAVVALIESRVPLYEFVIKAALAGNDLETPEGRVAALRAAAPIVARIKDGAIGPEYARRLSGWLGMEPAEVMRAVTTAAKAGRGAAQGRPDVTAAVAVGPDAKDPVVRAERLALEVLLQMPEKVEPAWAAGIGPETFTVPQYRAVLDGIAAAGGIASAGKDWANRVADEVGEVLAPLVSELIVSPVPQDRPSEMGRYVKSVLSRVQDLSLTRRIGEVRGRMQRIGEGNEGFQAAFAELVALEGERRNHREE